MGTERDDNVHIPLRVASEADAKIDSTDKAGANIRLKKEADSSIALADTPQAVISESGKVNISGATRAQNLQETYASAFAWAEEETEEVQVDNQCLLEGEPPKEHCIARYTIERYTYGVAIYGTVPLNDMSMITNMCISLGFDVIDMTIAAQKNALLIITSNELAPLWLEALSSKS